MKYRIEKLSCFAFAVTLLLGLAGCSSPQRQQSQDEKTRGHVANATAKLKEESRVAAKNLDEAARQAGFWRLPSGTKSRARNFDVACAVPM